ncbi:unnamed protein product [Schistocephalus solidus]|uniref:Translocator protein n=1 Tax=Schistocephalus solidus TaxID=70667 RepID=A0A183TF85_SCHSO|nr:unnamed protein product [Schistocephalus solidus]
MQHGLLVACVATPYIGAFIGSRFANNNKAWYHRLKHPSYTPPDWVFGPAWTMLYGCIGAASYLVAKEAAEQDVRLPLAVYGISLLLNWSWTPVFFGMHRLKTTNVMLSPIKSVGIIISTMIAAVGSHYLFYQVNPTAGLMMLPYVLWLCFASSLNIGMAYLNQPPSEKKSS